MRGTARERPIREEINTVVFTKNDRRVPTGVDKPSSILVSLSGEVLSDFQCGGKIWRLMFHSLCHDMKAEKSKQVTIREGERDLE